MVAGNSKSDISFAGIFASSAFAACFAEKGIAGDGMGLPKYRGMLGTVATIAREEGLASLWKGIVPGLHRQCLYGGALAIAVANPTDLVKVRLQAEGKLPAGVPRRYSGALNAYSTIVKQEGVRALWTGIGPNVARNAIINAAELASYDQVKQVAYFSHNPFATFLTCIVLQKKPQCCAKCYNKRCNSGCMNEIYWFCLTILKIPGFTDNVLTHLLSGLGAGFFAVCIGSPVDVVKSRMMGDSSYTSTVDCFIKTLKNDGPLAFYKGFIPNFGRLGSWNVIMFLTLEQAKKFVQSIGSS
ncbi:Mitochondrial brown fat uncoupling protein [Cynara cardunculus var. scolymus]|uniref:Mitochondrial brown fat uncoupling protein n=1 Tax=Cynara cardunculus var. scolymus TaxID=59895 RepID=A0A118K1U0_CYNCS|nr:Mitochondrial brown fat uncoupling protein [Cynara cardunculus var. scolymus]